MAGVGYQSTQNVRDLTQQQRDLIQWHGDQLGQEFQNQGDEGRQFALNYGNFLDPITQNMAAGNGGYSPEEAAAIQGNGGPNGLNNLPTSQDQLRSNFLTGDETDAMRGDTGSYSDYFDPNGMHDQMAASQGVQDSAVGGLKAGLGNSINPNSLRQDQGYRDYSHDTLNSTNAGVQGALGSERTGTRGVISGEQGNVRGAIDPAALSQSADAAKIEVMTPEEEQRMVTAAGASMGARNQAAVGSLERQARAAGSSPLGVAAYRARMNTQTAAEAGDAMTQARVSAQQARASEQLGSENQRIGAQQQLAGLRTGTEMQMGQQQLQNEQSLGQQGTAASEYLGQMGLGQANTEEANRQAAEQYLTGAQMQAATTGGEAELQNAQQKTAQGQQQNQFNVQAGTNIREAQDVANAGRASTIAGNRQQTNEGNQSTAFGQGFQVNNAGSQRATQVGNARLGQQNTGLAAQQGQEQMQNSNSQAGYGRQLGAYGTTTGGTNQAAGLQLNANGTPTTTDKVLGGVLGGIGAAASFLEDGGVATPDDPKLAVIGEHGPEAVVPINSGGYRARMHRPIAPPKKRIPMRYGRGAA
jgi:hypothetical protein